MNKLSIALLTIVCCTQQIHSMELGTPSSDDCGYQVIAKPYNDRPQSPISKKRNHFSEQLYKDHITDTEIRELVSKGAILNYKGEYVYAIAVHFAFDRTKQGVKNMETIIELKADIHHRVPGGHFPLDIAVQYNSTDMITLLLHHENPTVTIYESTYHDNDGITHRDYDYSEKELREYIIRQFFKNQNIPMIELLLKLKLMTANRGLKEFVQCMQSNKEILDLLLSYGATNISDIIFQLMDKVSKSKETIRTTADTIKNVMNDLQSLQ